MYQNDVFDIKSNNEILLRKSLTECLTKTYWFFFYSVIDY